MAWRLGWEKGGIGVGEGRGDGILGRREGGRGRVLDHVEIEERFGKVFRDGKLYARCRGWEATHFILF